MSVMYSSFLYFEYLDSLVSLFFHFLLDLNMKSALVKIESTRVIKRNMLGQIVDLHCVEVEEEIS
jgi:hypothetical protein